MFSDRVWQPASQPASHVAVAITLNAKASNLKTASWPPRAEADALRTPPLKHRDFFFWNAGVFLILHEHYTLNYCQLRRRTTCEIGQHLRKLRERVSCFFTDGVLRRACMTYDIRLLPLVCAHPVVESSINITAAGTRFNIFTVVVVRC